MRDVANAAYTLFCALAFMVFMFGMVTSVALALGLFGDSDYSTWVGCGCAVVFWYAAAKYRKLFRKRIEDVKKNINNTDDNDDSSDNSF